MHSPLFSGNVDTTLSWGCSDIGLYHRTKTLQYQLEGIAGTANIPRRGKNLVLYNPQYTVQCRCKETYGVYLLFSKNFNSGKTNIAMSSVQRVLYCQTKYNHQNIHKMGACTHTSSDAKRSRCPQGQPGCQNWWQLQEKSADTHKYNIIQNHRCNKSAKEWAVWIRACNSVNLKLVRIYRQYCTSNM